MYWRRILYPDGLFCVICRKTSPLYCASAHPGETVTGEIEIRWNTLSLREFNCLLWRLIICGDCLSDVLGEKDYKNLFIKNMVEEFLMSFENLKSREECIKILNQTI